jgi:TRAP-type mannitol/chloroaromatic compound transport system permease large subunit
LSCYYIELNNGTLGKKTTEEYKKFLSKRMFSLSSPIWVLFIFIGTAIFRLLGTEWERPISVSELVAELPGFFITFLFVAAIVYAIQIL